MKILITGSTGLLGQALARQLASWANVVGVSRHDAVMLGEAAHVVGDLAEPDVARQIVERVSPDVVVHAQALSNVDQCEVDSAQAYRMNAEAPDLLCRACAPRQIPVVALSTDYVFNGAKSAPYDEHDETRPINIYGLSKLDGERTVLRYSRGYVVRPSTLYGPARQNFCHYIVDQAQQGRPIQAFLDQTTSPTYTADLAQALHAMLRELSASGGREVPRVLHLANSGGCRRTEFAARALQLLNRSLSLLQPIGMVQQARPAARPSYSVLTSRYAANVIGTRLRSWDAALEAYLRFRHWIN